MVGFPPLGDLTRNDPVVSQLSVTQCHTLSTIQSSDSFAPLLSSKYAIAAATMLCEGV